ncbi:unnamed protein product [Rhodiola kirilowii]
MMSSMYPFTATQWQELELQALIFKFMVSGHPIPPHLIFNINGKRCFTNQPQHTGWSCFEVGVSRKTDPEPTRCRRTDGKKWRCSKQASSGDSKYCERHMHRGKSRPRKLRPLQTQNQSKSNLSSVTSDMSCSHHSNSKSVKDITFLAIDSCWKLDHSDYKSTSNQKLLTDDEDVNLIDRNEKRQRTKYYQFMDESPQLNRDSLPGISTPSSSCRLLL